MSAITTHVLDTSLGRPAEGVPVVLRIRVGNTWRELGRGVTDANGRVTTLMPDGDPLAAGMYKLRFDTEAYFSLAGAACFYPEVAVVFTLKEPGGHYHLPLLLNPFGYTTYRGS